MQNNGMQNELLRQIPKMDKLLLWPKVSAAAGRLPSELVKDCLNGRLHDLREQILRGGAMPSEEELDASFAASLQKASQFGLRRTINATGVILHTNLGRAPLGSEIAKHLADTAAGYSNLEYDLQNGCRGSRTETVERLLCAITGAEAAVVVNNNAAAVFLMLHTLARDKGCAISRGELVEIGGSFRVPEIMAQTGARLVEVGTTNKTHPGDYSEVLENGQAEILLKVHTSNFRVCGFTEAVGLPELSELSRKHGVPLLYDLGAGWLLDAEAVGVHDGVSVSKAVPYCDVLCFSGDKLLGGTQAGIILGKKEYINRLRKNQLLRMLRVDKLTLCVLEAVLRWYQSPKQAPEHIPTLVMCAKTAHELHSTADSLAKRIADACPKLTVTVEPCEDALGGGSTPGNVLPGFAVCVKSDTMRPEQMDAFARSQPLPLVGMIRKECFCLSVRTLFENDFDQILSIFREMGEKA